MNSTNPEPPGEPGEKTNWLCFFIVLLAPATMTLIALFLEIELLAMLLTFGGSLVAGIICSSILAYGQACWRSGCQIH